MNRITLLLTCLLSVVFSTVVNAQTPDKTVTILTTYDLGYVWNPLDVEVPLSASELLQEEFEQFLYIQENPVSISLGHSLNPKLRVESAYNSNIISFYESQNFDAIHFDSSDFATNTNKDYGMRERSKEMNSLMLSGLQGSKSFADHFSFNKLIEKENLSIALASIASKELVSGIPNIYKVAATQTFAEAESFFAESNADLNLLIIEPDSTLELTHLDLAPSADAMLVIGDQTTAALSLSALPVFQISDGSNFTAIHATLQNDTWSFDRLDHSWIDPTILTDLKIPESPIIGMSIPPPGRLAERLGIDSSDVGVEVFRDHEFASLTSREEIYVYDVRIEDKPYRVIRVRNYVGFGWVFFDGVVVINRDNTIRQVIVNNPYMKYDEKPTRFYEAIQSVYNKPVDEWDIDPKMIAGIEHMSEIHLDALRKTLEISSQIPFN